MFSKYKNYKLILFKNNSTDIKELNLFNISIIISSFFILFFTLFFVSFYSTDLNKIISMEEIRKHKKNNSDLHLIILEYEEKLNILNRELNLIKQKDESLRKLANLPIIDEDTRKLGTGGFSKKKNNELDYLLPIEVDLDHMKSELDFIHRTLNLEHISYSEIENVLNDNLEYFLHYPAIYPVKLDKLNLSSRYGYRIDPFSKRKKFHDGDDFSADIGTDVIATANGTVKVSKRNGSFGNYIEIDHGNGYLTVYGHLHNRGVKVGDKVLRGDKIGEVGNTGRSTAPHLHYEILYNKKHINPKNNYFQIN
ncbi:MAG: peptidase M23 [Candidatus Marinimicrobia bacterium]|nr:peptidase M23 [Candidatus Neomarinimicrobiota bacterium]|tara:strand:- start:1397 stop:2323 length:927 start_codon:yes stop_codon:yes gene_type:complete